MKSQSKVWAVIPAGGVGSRMGTDIPKQYLYLNEFPVLHHTLGRICASGDIDGVVLGLSENDEWWNQLPFMHRKMVGNYPAGPERVNTVLNGLDFLFHLDEVNSSDWVMVHDAARPCINQEDVSRVIIRARQNQIGAVLGRPLMDTLKRSSERSMINSTVDRSGMWQAMTPQIFRLSELKDAILFALDSGIDVTDESSAMEHSGIFAELVEGHPGNIKITTQTDLAIAEKFI